MYLKHTFNHPEPIRTVAMRDNTVIVVLDSGAVLLYDCNRPEYVKAGKGQKGIVRRLVVPADEPYFLTASDDGSVIVWDMRTFRIHASLFGHNGGATDAVFFNSETLVTASDSGDAIVWDMSTGNNQVFTAGAGAVQRLTVEGALLVSGGRDGTVRVWDITTGRHRVLGKHRAPVTDVKISPDGRTVVSLDHNHTIHVWNITSGTLAHATTPPQTAHSQLVTSYLVATIDHAGTPHLWDTITGGRIQTMRPSDSPVRCVALHPRGMWLFGGTENGDYCLWDTAFGNELYRLRRLHDAPIHIIALSRFGNLTATASADGKLNIIAYSF